MSGDLLESIAQHPERSIIQHITYVCFRGFYLKRALEASPSDPTRWNCFHLVNTEFKQISEIMLKDPTYQEMLKNPNTQFLMGNIPNQETLKNPELQTLLKVPEVQSLLENAQDQ